MALKNKNLNKKALSPIVIAMDVIGFALILLGAGMIRFAKDEILAILGGFVLAGGVAVLGITRFLSKW